MYVYQYMNVCMDGYPLPPLPCGTKLMLLVLISECLCSALVSCIYWADITCMMRSIPPFTMDETRFVILKLCRRINAHKRHHGACTCTVYIHIHMEEALSSLTKCLACMWHKIFHVFILHLEPLLTQLINLSVKVWSLLR